MQGPVTSHQIEVCNVQNKSLNQSYKQYNLTKAQTEVELSKTLEIHMVYRQILPTGFSQSPQPTQREKESQTNTFVQIFYVFVKHTNPTYMAMKY